MRQDLAEEELGTLILRVVEKLIESGIRVLIRPHPNEDFKAYKFIKNKFYLKQNKHYKLRL